MPFGSHLASAHKTILLPRVGDPHFTQLTRYGEVTLWLIQSVRLHRDDFAFLHLSKFLYEFLGVFHTFCCLQTRNYLLTAVAQVQVVDAACEFADFFFVLVFGDSSSEFH